MDGQRLEHQNLDELNERIAPFMIKRPKHQLLPQLPEKIRTTLEVRLTPREQSEYDALVADFKKWLRDRGVVSSADKMVKVLRMRQLLDSPSLIMEDGTVMSSKLQTVKDLVGSTDEKIVVFTQWAKMAKILHQELGGHIITGNTSSRKRLDLVNEFNDDHVQTLITTDALAHGVDIIGASIIVHYDQLYNPAKMVEQREGRLHRIGQKNVVNAYTLVCEGTVEEYVAAVGSSREDLATGVYDGAADSLMGRMTEADLVGALKGVIPSGGQ